MPAGASEAVSIGPIIGPSQKITDSFGDGLAASHPTAPTEFHRFTQLGPKDFTGLAP
jgi:hypothetical protein